ncbi:MAG: hypothetical protein ILP12_07750 [Lachnospiraceae bacterium]|nr:hypothetical protein [Lachnospiraceae bacterium]
MCTFLAASAGDLIRRRIPAVCLTPAGSLADSFHGMDILQEVLDVPQPASPQENEEESPSLREETEGFWSRLFGRKKR